MTYRINRPDGKIRWIHDRSFSVSDDEGEVRRIVGVATDITEQKSVEQHLHRSQRMESIGTLAGGLAHDLNNVLAPIVLLIDVLKRTETDPARLEHLASIMSSAMRGSEMIAKVLAFARGDEGARLEVKMGAILREVARIGNDTFLKSIDIEVFTPPDLWSVSGDPTRLHQVVLNLIVNARDAMPQGGSLKLTAENLVIDSPMRELVPEAKPGPYVVVHVQDTGIGIAPEDSDRVFDPFYSTKPLGTGTGLGLSTSLAIARSHGGFIRVYSEPGRGSRFDVYLPASPVSEIEATTELAEELPAGNGELVLVVDDEAAVRQITMSTLQKFGYEVLVASDGGEALEILRKNPGIDLVLTDLMMPGVSGSELIKEIGRSHPTIPIIVASGLLTEARLADVADLITGSLSKPFTASTLLRTTRSALDRGLTLPSP